MIHVTCSHYLKPRLSGNKLVVYPYTISRVACLTRYAPPREPTTEADIVPSYLYLVSTGIRLSEPLPWAIERDLAYRGLVIEHQYDEPQGVELIIRNIAAEKIPINQTTPMFVVYGAFSGDTITEHHAPQTPSQAPQKQIFILPRAPQTPRRTDEEPEVRISVKPGDGKTGPIVSRVLDPVTLEFTGKTALASRDRVGVLKAHGVEGGTANKLQG